MLREGQPTLGGRQFLSRVREQSEILRLGAHQIGCLLRGLKRREERESWLRAQSMNYWRPLDFSIDPSES